MRSHKRGVSQGVGEWDLYWWSDVVSFSSLASSSINNVGPFGSKLYRLNHAFFCQFSVGGYVSPRIEFTHMSPHCTIFAIHVCLLQTYTVTPIQEFRANSDNAVKHHYPIETFVLYKDGAVPSTKRPKTNGQVLFNAQSPREDPSQNNNNADGISSFTWQPGRIRINDDHSMRPSVFPGTHTPLEITHQLSLRVFFAIKGETMEGRPIVVDDTANADADAGEGEMRMLVINVGERVSSVCFCTTQRCVVDVVWCLHDVLIGLAGRCCDSAVQLQSGHNYQDVRTHHDAVTPGTSLFLHCADRLNHSRPLSDEECVCGADAPEVPYCACCYKMQDFPGVGFEEAFPRLDVEEEERRRERERDGQQRKSVAVGGG